MMMPHAPMHEMSGMGMKHGAEAAGMGSDDMSPVDVSRAPAAGPNARGGQMPQPTMHDGVKEFELSTGVVRWSILPDVEVGPYAYKWAGPGTADPGPTQRAHPGAGQERLTERTTVHGHGLILPLEHDGVPGISHPPIDPGGEHSNRREPISTTPTSTPIASSRSGSTVR